MSTIADFLNHGLFPFVGRGDERKRLVDFWRGAAERNALGALLLLGEAGIGKSRLVAEALRTIQNEGGATIHIRLRPEALSAMIPLVAAGISGSAAPRGIFPRPIDENLPSVIAALRRLCRLRRVILAVEDIHLLTGDPVGEFGSLLDALVDEPLALLCAARPVDFPTRGVLERYPLDEMILRGLNDREIGELWHHTLGSDGDAGAIATLHASTFGNPLALRSALRGSIKQGALIQRHDGSWQTERSFAAVAKRGADSLIEGMAAHLNEEERGAAARLASLGEAFAREGALLMLGDDGRLLPSLIFKGIIVESTTAVSPLAGSEPSAYPVLAFTHSLLHDRFVQQEQADAPSLMMVLASGVPLYSLLPFQLLHRNAGALPGPLDADTARRALDRTLRIGGSIDTSPDWKLSAHIHECAEVIAERFAPVWTPVEAREMRALLMLSRLFLLARAQHTEEYVALAAEALAVTDPPESEMLAQLRLRAITYSQVGEWRRSENPDYRTSWEEMQSYIAARPWLRQSTTYFFYIEVIVRGTYNTRPSHELLEEIEREFDAAYRSIKTITPEYERLRRRILGDLLTLYATDRELQRRLAMLGEFDSQDPDAVWLQPKKVELLYAAGRMDEAITAARRAAVIYRERNLHCGGAYIVELAARAAIGESLDRILADTERIHAGLDEPYCHWFRGDMVSFFPEVALFRGDPGWLRRVLERFPGGGEHFAWQYRLLSAGTDAERAEAIEEVKDEPLEPLAMMAAFALGDTTSDAGKIAETAEELASELPSSIDSISTAYILDWVTRRVGERNRELGARLRATMERVSGHCLRFLAANRLPAYMRPFLTACGGYLPPEERAAWTTRITELERERGAVGDQERDDRVHLSMIGAITACKGAETFRPRGARLKTLLGVMAGERMLGRPLERDRFLRIASGEADDPRHARGIINTTIHRLRSSLGDDAILTDGEIPRLNPARVRVDLLEAAALLETAAGATRAGALQRGVEALGAVFEIWSGGVLFPTLYDEFFETLRETFENDVRAAALALARALAREGDADGARILLGNAARLLPDDPELAELHRQAGSGAAA